MLRLIRHEGRRVVKNWKGWRAAIGNNSFFFFFFFYNFGFEEFSIGFNSSTPRPGDFALPHHPCYRVPMQTAQKTLMVLWIQTDIELLWNRNFCRFNQTHFHGLASLNNSNNSNNNNNNNNIYIGHCTRTAESAAVQVQSVFHGRNHITFSTDFKYRTVATLYTLATWLVSGI